MALKNTADNRKFVSVLADGKLHMNVPTGTEGAVVREYETSDGKKGSKTELVFTELSGKISNIAFYDGEYGNQLQVTIVDGEEEPVVLSLGTQSNFGEDAMKKLPNVKLDEEVRIVPFAFEDDKGKMKKGISIYQDKRKITNYFYDPENQCNINGYPEPKKNTKSSDQWKAYFLETRLFLVDFTTKFFKLDEVTTSSAKDTTPF